MLRIPEDKLKEVLVTEGLVSETVFADAQKEARRMNRDVADILVSRGLITFEYYTDLLVKFYDVERANLASKKVDETIIKLLPEKLAREKRAVVFNRRQDGSFDVALEDPTNLQTVEFLSKHLGGKINSYLASREDLNRGFSHYGRHLAQEFKQVIEDNIQRSLALKVTGIKEAAEELPIVAIVDNLIAYAISSRASDIHIEILGEGILVRYRVDGILREIIRMPREVHSAIVARVKLLAGLKLDEHSKAQDGRFRHKVGKDLMDMRVAIMPTFYGEKVEMRLLSATEKPLSLEELGFLRGQMNVITNSLKKAYGMVLITGPTGSGKTTTLYSLVNIINRPEVNIVTIEDPVEYDMKYINQTQINPAAGITFAQGLREIVRQDPNIIMVGEIRDKETARIAVQAALTGHLLMSSLHTNDAVTTIPRLIDLGVPPFLVAASLNLIEAQRLVRRIHKDCIVSYKPEPAVIETIKEQLAESGLGNTELPTTFYKGVGCSSCAGGYKGRVGIFELFEMNEEARRLIVRPDFTLGALRQLARKQNMVTLLQDGMRKVELGLTTIDEILRVIKE